MRLLAFSLVNLLMNRVWTLPLQMQDVRSDTETKKSVDAIFNIENRKILAWDRLAEMTDLYGSRLSGSPSLEKSLDWIVATATKKDNLTVRSEPVNVFYWQRGEESLQLLAPTTRNLNYGGGDTPVELPVIGLGNSTSTDENGVEGSLVVVRSEKEFNNADIRGKIVLWNVPYTSYGSTVRYRRWGRVAVEKRGGIAMLVRSVTPFSLSSFHTGITEPAMIPAAAVTIETAEFLDRIYNRYVNRNYSTSLFADQFVEPRLRLKLKSIRKPAKSRNILVEVKGRELPDEVVVVGGHIDSWDIGTGAVDDGGGAFIGWEAVRIISGLKRLPRRTVRAVFWADEEVGGAGATEYASARKRDNTLHKHVFAMESDEGVFRPFGLFFANLNQTNVLSTLKEYGQIYGGRRDGFEVVKGGAEADILPLCQLGVLCAGWQSYDAINREIRPDQPGGHNGYFYWHHTWADDPSKLNAADMANSAKAMAVWAYVIAEHGLRPPNNSTPEA
ncbi:uncharacterized protein VTP21DRAFT_6205 [Calcarisporiella thermophila]|uniref:uncharacterized protein n=1 Tax=Calcarisporiella thermophila TaxID=911321 RepID=UPI0037423FD7